ncbi:hypothetical protein [Vibrio phage 33Fb.4]|nr:hypothetical protein [Vibrio phage 31Fb.4]WAG58466.1 hypothetical protein [Vibrio phage 33Fb.4]
MPRRFEIRVGFRTGEMPNHLRRFYIFSLDLRSFYIFLGFLPGIA